MEKKRKKIGIFGGSFNPIHSAHVAKVKEVLVTGLIDEVWLMPCRKHAFDKELISSDARIEMINLAFDGVEKVRVSTEEIDWEGMSYALDTIKRLKKKFDYDFVWLGGSDLIYEIKKWYHYKEFLEMVEFIIFLRKGYPIKDVEGMKILKVIESNSISNSSTEIRLRCELSEPLDSLVPNKVREYILQNNLYKKVYLP